MLDYWREQGLMSRGTPCLLRHSQYPTWLSLRFVYLVQTMHDWHLHAPSARGLLILATRGVDVDEWLLKRAAATTQHSPRELHRFAHRN